MADEHELAPAAVKEKLDAGDAQLVDVREPGEWDEHRIAGSVLIPLDSLTAQGGRDRDRPRGRFRLQQRGPLPDGGRCLPGFGLSRRTTSPAASRPGSQPACQSSPEALSFCQSLPRGEGKARDRPGGGFGGSAAGVRGCDPGDPRPSRRLGGQGQAHLPGEHASGVPQRGSPRLGPGVRREAHTRRRAGRDPRPQPGEGHRLRGTGGRQDAGRAEEVPGRRAGEPGKRASLASCSPSRGGRSFLVSTRFCASPAGERASINLEIKNAPTDPDFDATVRVRQAGDERRGGQRDPAVARDHPELLAGRPAHGPPAMPGGGDLAPHPGRAR